jgi:putative ABC transport system ATP-binding protein
MSSIIAANEISKTYHRGAELINAINRVSLEIKAGQFVSFVGPSGSGKTTLLHLLGCLDEPSEGELTVDGTKVFSVSYGLKEKKLTLLRRDLFGYIFQKFYLIPTLNVKENIMLPLAFSRKGVSSQEVNLLARKLGLDHRLGHLPRELSGGEMQRVAIARALLNKPKILLADEPTGNLDSQRSDEIADILYELNKQDGITVILVTHNPQLARKADTCIHLVDGKIVSQTES